MRIAHFTFLLLAGGLAGCSSRESAPISPIGGGGGAYGGSGEQPAHSTPPPAGDDDDDAAAKTPSPDTKTTTPPPATSATKCPDTKLHYKIADGGSFTWTVAKGDGTPVTGLHTVRGEVIVTKADAIGDTKMQLDFSKTGAFTGQTLRDERLGANFFGASNALRFTLDAVTAKDGKLALPDLGVSRDLVLTGSFQVAGISIIKVDVPVLLANRGDTLHVSEALSGVSFKPRADWGLDKPLDAFLALAQAKIFDGVTLRFDLDLEKSCAN